MDVAPYRVLGDQPYSGDSDPLEFQAVARRLRSLIFDSRASTPFAIGIEASWGRGKSTLMERLRCELERGPEGAEVRTVSYNAWTAEGEDVLAGLVKSVLQAMDPNVLRRALRDEKLMSWARLLVTFVAGVLRLGGVVDEAWKRLSVDASTRNQVNELVRKAMKDWLANVPELGPKRLIVVFIDDLDRCSSENVLRVFEGLKLYLDAPGFVFVIGYDETVISTAVAERNQAGGRASGRDYIEKIVQIVFRIPQPTDEEVERLLDGFLADSGTTGLFDEAARKLLIDRNGRNPRRMKRFVNRFVVDRELDEGSRDMPAELLVKLLLLETYFPEFARLFLAEGDANPIRQFLDFATAWEALRRRDRDSAKGTIESVFEVYGLAVPRDATEAELFESLEREATPQFVSLVRDPEFVSLARSIGSADDQKLILAKVQRRRERVMTAAASELDNDYDGGFGDLGGRRILWVGTWQPPLLLAGLREAGADLVLTTGGLSPELVSVPPDLIVVDLESGTPRATITALDALHATGDYTGPAIFRHRGAPPESMPRPWAFEVRNAAELAGAIRVALPTGK